MIFYDTENECCTRALDVHMYLDFIVCPSISRQLQKNYRHGSRIPKTHVLAAESNASMSDGNPRNVGIDWSSNCLLLALHYHLKKKVSIYNKPEVDLGGWNLFKL